MQRQFKATYAPRLCLNVPAVSPKETELSPRSSWNRLRRAYVGNSDTQAANVLGWKLSTQQCSALACGIK